MKEDQARLKSLIVESPEELRNEKEKMKETVKKIKQTIVRTIPSLIRRGVTIPANGLECQASVQCDALLSKTITKQG